MFGGILKKIMTRILISGRVILPVFLAAGFALSAKTLPAPVIERFYATPAPVVRGETLQVFWRVSDAKRIEIDGFPKAPDMEWPLDGSEYAALENTTVFTLRAYGANGEIITKSIVVEVVEKGPVIEYFNSTPDTIVRGDFARISWKVSNAERIEIDGFVKDCDCIRPLEDSDLTAPESTTTFTLRAYSADGRVSTATTIVTVVDDAPIIDRFTASKFYITKGQLVMLTWETRNTKECTLLTDHGAKLRHRPSNGRIGVTPNQTTTYTLVATDAKGHETSRSFTVIVSKQ